jgi:hypothetical protein
MKSAWMIDDPTWMIDDPTWMIDHPTPTPSNSGSNAHFLLPPTAA